MLEMTKYQLAKLLLMAGGLDSRKRIQKTVHLLQAGGCQLDVNFRLHYYGPYSSDLAELLNRMTADKMLIENEQETPVGTQYDYRLSDKSSESLESYEATAEGRAAKEAMQRHRELLDTLCKTPPRVLELASTIVAFREDKPTWDEAVQKTAAFKDEPEGSPNMTNGRHLAERVVGSDDG